MRGTLALSRACEERQGGSELFIAMGNVQNGRM
jgi:hypothetical protein